jgi:hypothetical protein
LRNGAAWRKPARRAASSCWLETFVLALQAIAFTFRVSPLALRLLSLTLHTRQFVAQAVVLDPQALKLRVAIIRRLARAIHWHAMVMPDLRNKYKLCSSETR